MNTEQTNEITKLDLLVQAKQSEHTFSAVVEQLTIFCNKLERMESQVENLNNSLAKISELMSEVNLSLDSILFKMEETNQAFDS